MTADTIVTVPVQVRLGSRLYTYGVRCAPGSEPSPGDTVVIPGPWWLPGGGQGSQRAALVNVGDGCVDTGYRGPLTFARVVRA